MTRMFSFPTLDRFLGRGSAAVTVPPFDGGLKPNNSLEELPAGIPANAPDDLALWKGSVIWSDGGKLYNDKGATLIEMGSAITALASRNGLIALATLADGLRILDEKLADITPSFDVPVTNITALTFGPDGAVWFCSGSEQNAPDEWRRDLMEQNSSGKVGFANLTSGKVQVVRSGLSWPAGIIVRANGSVAVSEAWKSQLVDLGAQGTGYKVVLDEIPGYPGRLSERADGGYWLCIFAPRSPLIEFVLREPEYRKAMLRDLEPAHWVAPSYSSGANFREPMQGGALRQMGILKPWAPTLSYGLVSELDGEFTPQRSYHSRAGGKRHGMTSALANGNTLWVAGHGCGEVLKIELTDQGTLL